MFIKRDKPNIDTVISYSNHMEGIGLAKPTIDSREFIEISLNDYLEEKYDLDLSSNKISDVKGYMLSEWFQTLDVSDATKNLYVGNIQYFFKYLVQSGYVDKDASEVLQKVRIIKDDSEDDDDDELAYTADDAIALIKVRQTPMVDARDRAMTATLLAGGFRASELCSLDVGTFRNMRNGKMYVKRKGGARKWVYVADYAIDYIEKYLEERPDAKDEEPLFITSKNKRITRTQLWERMKKRQDYLGLETGVHIMRHTFLTEVDRRNPFSITQKLGAHADARTTQIYVNPTQDELRSAANSVSWGKRLSKD